MSEFCPEIYFGGPKASFEQGHANILQLQSSCQWATKAFVAADRPLCGALSGLQSGVADISTYVCVWVLSVCGCVCVSYCVFGVCLVSWCMCVCVWACCFSALEFNSAMKREFHTFDWVLRHGGGKGKKGNPAMIWMGLWACKSTRCSLSEIEKATRTHT